MRLGIGAELLSSVVASGLVSHIASDGSDPCISCGSAAHGDHVTLGIQGASQGKGSRCHLGNDRSSARSIGAFRPRYWAGIALDTDDDSGGDVGGGGSSGSTVGGGKASDECSVGVKS